MKLFRFDEGVGVPVTQFDSVNVVVARIARTTNFTQIGCFHLTPNGVVGYHQATMPQLFLVVQGEGWVRGESNERVSIKPGQAAFWTSGEWHESGTDTGMSAIVIESESLDPTTFIKEA